MKIKGNSLAHTTNDLNIVKITFKVKKIINVFFLFFFSAAGFCVLSLVCAFALAYFDIRNSRILKKDQAKTGISYSM